MSWRSPNYFAFTQITQLDERFHRKRVKRISVGFWH